MAKKSINKEIFNNQFKGVQRPVYSIDNHGLLDDLIVEDYEVSDKLSNLNFEYGLNLDNYVNDATVPAVPETVTLIDGNAAAYLKTIAAGFTAVEKNTSGISDVVRVENWNAASNISINGVDAANIYGGVVVTTDCNCKTINFSTSTNRYENIEAIVNGPRTITVNTVKAKGVYGGGAGYGSVLNGEAILGGDKKYGKAVDLRITGVNTISNVFGGGQKGAVVNGDVYIDIAPAVAKSSGKIGTVYGGGEDAVVNGDVYITVHGTNAINVGTISGIGKGKKQQVNGDSYLIIDGFSGDFKTTIKDFDQITLTSGTAITLKQTQQKSIKSATYEFIVDDKTLKQTNAMLTWNKSIDVGQIYITIDNDFASTVNTEFQTAIFSSTYLTQQTYEVWNKGLQIRDEAGELVKGYTTEFVADVDAKGNAKKKGGTIVLKFEGTNADITAEDVGKREFSAANDDVNIRGEYVAASVDTGAGDDTVTVQKGTVMAGNIDTGTGNDSVNLQTGTIVTGDIALGEGENALRVLGDAEMVGSIIVDKNSKNVIDVNGTISQIEGGDSTTENIVTLRKKDAVGYYEHVNLLGMNGALDLGLNGEVISGEISLGEYRGQFVPQDLDFTNSDGSNDTVLVTQASEWDGNINFGKGKDTLVLNTTAVDENGVPASHGTITAEDGDDVIVANQTGVTINADKLKLSGIDNVLVVSNGVKATVNGMAIGDFEPEYGHFAGIFLGQNAIAKVNGELGVQSFDGGITLSANNADYNGADLTILTAPNLADPEKFSDPAALKDRIDPYYSAGAVNGVNGFIKANGRNVTLDKGTTVIGNITGLGVGTLNEGATINGDVTGNNAAVRINLLKGSTINGTVIGASNLVFKAKAGEEVGGEGLFFENDGNVANIEVTKGVIATVGGINGIDGTTFRGSDDLDKDTSHIKLNENAALYAAGENNLVIGNVTKPTDIAATYGDKAKGKITINDDIKSRITLTDAQDVYVARKYAADGTYTDVKFSDGIKFVGANKMSIKSGKLVLDHKQLDVSGGTVQFNVLDDAELVFDGLVKDEAINEKISVNIEKNGRFAHNDVMEINDWDNGNFKSDKLDNRTTLEVRQAAQVATALDLGAAVDALTVNINDDALVKGQLTVEDKAVIKLGQREDTLNVAAAQIDGIIDAANDGRDDVINLAGSKVNGAKVVMDGKLTDEVAIKLDAKDELNMSAKAVVNGDIEGGATFNANIVDSTVTGSIEFGDKVFIKDSVVSGSINAQNGILDGAEVGALVGGATFVESGKDATGTVSKIGAVDASKANVELYADDAVAKVGEVKGAAEAKDAKDLRLEARNGARIELGKAIDGNFNDVTIQATHENSGIDMAGGLTLKGVNTATVKIKDGGKLENLGDVMISGAVTMDPKKLTINKAEAANEANLVSENGADLTAGNVRLVAKKSEIKISSEGSKNEFGEILQSSALTLDGYERNKGIPALADEAKITVDQKATFKADSIEQFAKTAEATFVGELDVTKAGIAQTATTSATVKVGDFDRATGEVTDGAMTVAGDIVQSAKEGDKLEKATVATFGTADVKGDIVQETAAEKKTITNPTDLAKAIADAEAMVALSGENAVGGDIKQTATNAATAGFVGTTDVKGGIAQKAQVAGMFIDGTAGVADDIVQAATVDAGIKLGYEDADGNAVAGTATVGGLIVQKSDNDTVLANAAIDAIGELTAAGIEQVATTADVTLDGTAKVAGDLSQIASTKASITAGTPAVAATATVEGKEAVNATVDVTGAIVQKAAENDNLAIADIDVTGTLNAASVEQVADKATAAVTGTTDVKGAIDQTAKGLLGAEITLAGAAKVGSVAQTAETTTATIGITGTADIAADLVQKAATNAELKIGKDDVAGEATVGGVLTQNAAGAATITVGTKATADKEAVEGKLAVTGALVQNGGVDFLGETKVATTATIDVTGELSAASIEQVATTNAEVSVNGDADIKGSVAQGADQATVRLAGTADVASIAQDARVATVNVAGEATVAGGIVQKNGEGAAVTANVNIGGKLNANVTQNAKAAEVKFDEVKLDDEKKLVSGAFVSTVGDVKQTAETSAKIVDALKIEQKYSAAQQALDKFPEEIGDIKIDKIERTVGAVEQASAANEVKFGIDLSADGTYDNTGRGYHKKAILDVGSVALNADDIKQDGNENVVEAKINYAAAGESDVTIGKTDIAFGNIDQTAKVGTQNTVEIKTTQASGADGQSHMTIGEIKGSVGKITQTIYSQKDQADNKIYIDVSKSEKAGVADADGFKPMEDFNAEMTVAGGIEMRAYGDKADNTLNLRGKVNVEGDVQVGGVIDGEAISQDSAWGDRTANKNTVTVDADTVKVDGNLTLIGQENDLDLFNDSYFKGDTETKQFAKDVALAGKTNTVDIAAGLKIDNIALYDLTDHDKIGKEGYDLSTDGNYENTITLRGEATALVLNKQLRANDIINVYGGKIEGGLVTGNGKDAIDLGNTVPYTIDGVKWVMGDSTIGGDVSMGIAGEAVGSNTITMQAFAAHDLANPDEDVAHNVAIGGKVDMYAGGMKDENGVYEAASNTLSLAGTGVKNAATNITTVGTATIGGAVTMVAENAYDENDVVKNEGSNTINMGPLTKIDGSVTMTAYQANTINVLASEEIIKEADVNAYAEITGKVDMTGKTNAINVSGAPGSDTAAKGAAAYMNGISMANKYADKDGKEYIIKGATNTITVGIADNGEVIGSELIVGKSVSEKADVAMGTIAYVKPNALAMNWELISVEKAAKGHDVLTYLGELDAVVTDLTQENKIDVKGRFDANDVTMMAKNNYITVTGDGVLGKGDGHPELTTDEVRTASFTANTVTQIAGLSTENSIIAQDTGSVKHYGYALLDPVTGEYADNLSAIAELPSVRFTTGDINQLQYGTVEGGQTAANNTISLEGTIIAKTGDITQLGEGDNKVTVEAFEAQSLDANQPLEDMGLKVERSTVGAIAQGSADLLGKQNTVDLTRTDAKTIDQFAAGYNAVKMATSTSEAITQTADGKNAADNLANYVWADGLDKGETHDDEAKTVTALYETSEIKGAITQTSTLEDAGNKVDTNLTNIAGAISQTGVGANAVSVKGAELDIGIYAGDPLKYQKDKGAKQTVRVAVGGAITQVGKTDDVQLKWADVNGNITQTASSKGAADLSNNIRLDYSTALEIAQTAKGTEEAPAGNNFVKLNESESGAITQVADGNNTVDVDPSTVNGSITQTAGGLNTVKALGKIEDKTLAEGELVAKGTYNPSKVDGNITQVSKAEEIDATVVANTVDVFRTDINGTIDQTGLNKNFVDVKGQVANDIQYVQDLAANEADPTKGIAQFDKAFNSTVGGDILQKGGYNNEVVLTDTTVEGKIDQNSSDVNKITMSADVVNHAAAIKGLKPANEPDGAPCDYPDGNDHIPYTIQEAGNFNTQAVKGDITQIVDVKDADTLKALNEKGLGKTLTNTLEADNMNLKAVTQTNSDGANEIKINQAQTYTGKLEKQATYVGEIDEHNDPEAGKVTKVGTYDDNTTTAVGAIAQTGVSNSAQMKGVVVDGTIDQTTQAAKVTKTAIGNNELKIEAVADVTAKYVPTMAWDATKEGAEREVIEWKVLGVGNQRAQNEVKGNITQTSGASGNYVAGEDAVKNTAELYNTQVTGDVVQTVGDNAYVANTFTSFTAQQDFNGLVDATTGVQKPYTRLADKDFITGKLEQTGFDNTAKVANVDIKGEVKQTAKMVRVTEDLHGDPDLKGEAVGGNLFEVNREGAYSAHNDAVKELGLNEELKVADIAKGKTIVQIVDNANPNEKTDIAKVTANNTINATLANLAKGGSITQTTTYGANSIDIDSDNVTGKPQQLLEAGNITQTGSSNSIDAQTTDMGVVIQDAIAQAKKPDGIKNYAKLAGSVTPLYTDGDGSVEDPFVILQQQLAEYADADSITQTVKQVADTALVEGKSLYDVDNKVVGFENTVDADKATIGNITQKGEGLVDNTIDFDGNARQVWDVVPGETEGATKLVLTETIKENTLGTVTQTGVNNDADISVAATVADIIQTADSVDTVQITKDGDDVKQTISKEAAVSNNLGIEDVDQVGTIKQTATSDKFTTVTYKNGEEDSSVPAVDGEVNASNFAQIETANTGDVTQKIKGTAGLGNNGITALDANLGNVDQDAVVGGNVLEAYTKSDKTHELSKQIGRVEQDGLVNFIETDDVYIKTDDAEKPAITQTAQAQKTDDALLNYVGMTGLVIDATEPVLKEGEDPLKAESYEIAKNNHVAVTKADSIKQDAKAVAEQDNMFNVAMQATNSVILTSADVGTVKQTGDANTENIVEFVGAQFAAKKVHVTTKKDTAGNDIVDTVTLVDDLENVIVPNVIGNVTQEKGVTNTATINTAASAGNIKQDAVSNKTIETKIVGDTKTVTESMKDISNTLTLNTVATAGTIEQTATSVAFDEIVSKYEKDGDAWKPVESTEANPNPKVTPDVVEASNTATLTSVNDKADDAKNITQTIKDAEGAKGVAKGGNVITAHDSNLGNVKQETVNGNNTLTATTATPVTGAAGKDVASKSIGTIDQDGIQNTFNAGEWNDDKTLKTAGDVTTKAITQDANGVTANDDLKNIVKMEGVITAGTKEAKEKEGVEDLSKVDSWMIPDNVKVVSAKVVSADAESITQTVKAVSIEPSPYKDKPEDKTAYYADKELTNTVWLKNADAGDVKQTGDAKTVNTVTFTGAKYQELKVTKVTPNPVDPGKDHGVPGEIVTKYSVDPKDIVAGGEYLTPNKIGNITQEEGVENEVTVTDAAEVKDIIQTAEAFQTIKTSEIIPVKTTASGNEVFDDPEYKEQFKVEVTSVFNTISNKVTLDNVDTVGVINQTAVDETVYNDTVTVLRNHKKADGEDNWIATSPTGTKTKTNNYLENADIKAKVLEMTDLDSTEYDKNDKNPFAGPDKYVSGANEVEVKAGTTVAGKITQEASGKDAAKTGNTLTATGEIEATKHPTEDALKAFYPNDKKSEAEAAFKNGWFLNSIADVEQTLTSFAEAPAEGADVPTNTITLTDINAGTLTQTATGYAKNVITSTANTPIDQYALKEATREVDGGTVNGWEIKEAAALNPTIKAISQTGYKNEIELADVKIGTVKDGTFTAGDITVNATGIFTETEDGEVWAFGKNVVTLTNVEVNDLLAKTQEGTVTIDGKKYVNAAASSDVTLDAVTAHDVTTEEGNDTITLKGETTITGTIDMGDNTWTITAKDPGPGYDMLPGKDALIIWGAGVKLSEATVKGIEKLETHGTDTVSVKGIVTGDFALDTAVETINTTTLDVGTITVYPDGLGMNLKTISAQADENGKLTTAVDYTFSKGFDDSVVTVSTIKGSTAAGDKLTIGNGTDAAELDSTVGITVEDFNEVTFAAKATTEGVTWKDTTGSDTSSLKFTIADLGTTAGDIGTALGSFEIGSFSGYKASEIEINGFTSTGGTITDGSVWANADDSFRYYYNAGTQKLTLASTAV